MSTTSHKTKIKVISKASEFDDFDISFMRSKSHYLALTNSYSGPQSEAQPETHPFAQLIHVKQGVAQVITPTGIWVVPPSKAVWIPAFQVHDAHFYGDVSFNHLFFKNKVLNTIPQDRCYLLNVSPLLREIFGYLALLNYEQPLKTSDKNLFKIILEHLEFEQQKNSLWLPYPTDDRLNKLCKLLHSDLGHKKSLNQHSKAAGLSLRNAQRLFKKETQLSLSAWQSLQKILRAMELLSNGSTVTETALEVGFQSTGAFSVRFREITGQTPSGYKNSIIINN